MHLSKVVQMSYMWNKYSIRLVPWNKLYSIIFFLLDQILLGTNIWLHCSHPFLALNLRRRKKCFTNTLVCKNIFSSYIQEYKDIWTTRVQL